MDICFTLHRIIESEVPTTICARPTPGPSMIWFAARASTTALVLPSSPLASLSAKHFSFWALEWYKQRLLLRHGCQLVVVYVHQHFSVLRLFHESSSPEPSCVLDQLWVVDNCRLGEGQLSMGDTFSLSWHSKPFLRFLDGRRVRQSNAVRAKLSTYAWAGIQYTLSRF